MTLWLHNLSCLIPVSETIMLHLPAIHKHQSPQRWSVREVACTLCMHTTQLCTLIMDYSNALMLLLMMTQGRRCQILCCMQLQSVESEGSCVCSPQVLPWELLCEGSHCLSRTAWTAASRGCCRSYNRIYCDVWQNCSQKASATLERLQNYAGRAILKELRVTSESWVWVKT